MEKEGNYLLSAIIPFTSNLDRVQNVIEIVRSSLDLPIKIILVYDSNDPIPEELQSLVKAHLKSIFLITGFWKGPGASRNAGLATVETEWITFWDSDDLPNSRLVLEMVQTAQLELKDCCVGGFEIVSKELSLNQKFFPNAREWQESAYAFPGLWRFAFKVSKVANIKFSQISMGEDQEYLAQALTFCSSIYIENRIIYSYIIGANDQLTKKVRDFSVLIQVYLSLKCLEGPTMPQVAKLIGVMKLRLLVTAIKRGSLKVKIFMLIQLFRAMFYYKTFCMGNVGNGLILSICASLKGERDEK